MAEEKRIIGDDGRLGYATLAESPVTSFVAGKIYKIITKAESGSIFGELAVGEFYPASTAIAGTAGDTATELEETNMLDLTSWGLTIQADEVPVTVLADVYKKYRKGKKDANGTASFQFIKGITDLPGGLANQFFKIVEVDGNGAVTVSPITTDSMYLIGYVCEETDVDETSTLTVLQVEFFNFDLPMNTSEAVTMEVPFRLVGNVDPIMYRVTNSSTGT